MSCYMLLDSRGRRFFVPDRGGAVRVSGLGVVDAGKLREAGAGRKIEIAGKEFLLLKPTVHDMMQSLERGPQLIMEKDASLIAHYLDVSPGSTVLEIGAGSGSLTLRLLYSAGRDGCVVTLDNRVEHLRIAASNVDRFGLGDSWHPVIADGRKPIGEAFADSVSIDIPDPWNAIGGARDALRPSGMLSSYSPTVNQTERTVLQALQTGFIHELSFEVMLRRIDVSEGATRHSFEGPGHTGYISIFRKVHFDK